MTTSFPSVAYALHRLRHEVSREDRRLLAHVRSVRVSFLMEQAMRSEMGAADGMVYSDTSKYMGFVMVMDPDYDGSLQVEFIETVDSHLIRAACERAGLPCRAI